MKTCLVFRHQGQTDFPPPSGNVRATFWRPGWLRFRPPGQSLPVALVWWLFDRLGVFAGCEYGVMVLEREGRFVHRSSVFPAFFRFAFVPKGELQIGDTYTIDSARGQGLALMAIHAILARFPGRTFWYVTEEDNEASIRVIEKAGFECVGTGRKRDRWKLKVTARYELD